ncbi:hypothetical protein ACH5BF_11080 [Arcobacter sp. YIC-464]|uniref:hypothetical protein n=1 Tax=Arcobacter sp. YIC-464 TaxID=3376631 RepID=UPI003C2459AF
MNFFFKINFFIFLFLSYLNATKIILSNVKEYKIDSQNIRYRIEAELKTIDYDKLKEFRFYNKKEVLSNSSFYINGNYSKKDLFISFKKGYFLEGSLLLFEIEGNYKNIPFKAKEAKVSRNKIDFKRVFITLDKKRYRKIKYSLKLD